MKWPTVCRSLVSACFALTACAQKPLPIDVVVASSSPKAVVAAAESLSGYLRQIQKGSVNLLVDGSEACSRQRAKIVVGGPSPNSDLGHQGYEWTRQNCASDGVVVRTRGADLLASQYAVYGLLERFNVRFYHPEQEWLPKPKVRLDFDQLKEMERFRPDFRERETYQHFMHPLELLEGYYAPTPEGDVRVKRWIDWQLKNRNTFGQWSGPTAEYAKERGFPSFGGLNLFEAQQGDIPLLVVTNPRPENEAKVVAAIEAQFATNPDMLSFGVSFSASEFPDTTPIDDREVVHYLTFIANYFKEHHPTTPLIAGYHGVHTQLTPNYQVPYFDLPLFAPDNLGMKIHTLMFYDLTRPAPVYGNQNFNHMRDLFAKHADKRRMDFFPEHSWWLTFDLPVPLYLPITMEARSADIQLLRPYALASDGKRGIVSHQAFASGQEWGYWQQDWCSSQMAFDTRLTYRDCFADFAEHSSSPATVKAALHAVTDLQVELLLGAYPEFIAYLVGSDDQTEAGLAVGIQFHPLPPTPQQIQAWDEAQVAMYEQIYRPMLVRWAEVFSQHAEALSVALATDDWVGQEIRDGIQITGLRAEHGMAITDAALLLRSAKLQRDPKLVTEARHRLEQAQALTAAARVVVERREKAYRYPLELSIAGDEIGTAGAIANFTQYPYRYLSRAHRLYYWTRPEGLLTALLDDPNVVSVLPRVVLANEPVAVGIREFDATNSSNEVSIDWGDGNQQDDLTPHAYVAQGLYSLQVSAIYDKVVAHSDTVAVVQNRRVTKPQDFDVEEPQAAGVLTSLFPGMLVGVGTDTSAFAVMAYDIDGDGNNEARSVVRLARDGDTTVPVDVEWPLINSSTKAVIARITLRNVSLDLSADRDVIMRLELVTEDIVRLLVELAAFDAEGARKTIATLLGYPESELPARLATRIRARVR